MDDELEPKPRRRVPWLGLVAGLQLVLIIALGALLFDTRLRIEQIWQDLPADMTDAYADEPAWVARIEGIANRAADNSAEAAESAEAARRSADKACREAAEFAFTC